MQAQDVDNNTDIVHHKIKLKSAQLLLHKVRDKYTKMQLDKHINHFSPLRGCVPSSDNQQVDRYVYRYEVCHQFPSTVQGP